MATRFLTALDYSDWHTSNVLRKHAKKRPLGELESRYQYTPPQPVLSCRTVDIDLSGTRTYRPRSTTDILDEQQKLIHRLSKNGRTATSAPPRRSPRKDLGQLNGNDSKTRANIHIQGRPCTSMSQTSDPGQKSTTSSSVRPKTTGNAKNGKSATDSFMVPAVDEDMLESRRSHNELTNQIHAHWRPENSNLNQGHFMRGQKRPDDVPPTLDAWLTFGGAASGKESGGVVDAFANFQSPEDYYNIEGSVGSRVAEQLQKGDKIRIGINGEVLSHNLKVKKWVKGDRTPAEDVQAERIQEEKEEEREERTPESSKEKPSPATENDDDLFGDMVFDSLDNIVETQEDDADGRASSASRRNKTVIDFPLSWEDQVSRPEVKVISARRTPRDNNRENLNETHPVLFNKVVRTSIPRPKLASTHATNGYRIKQRPLGSSTRADNRLDSTGNKVKAISFDQNSPEDEQRLNNMSVDDVVQMKLEQSTSSPIPGVPSGTARSKSKSGSRSKGQAEEGFGADSSAAAGDMRKFMDQKNRDRPQRSVSAVSKSSTGSAGKFSSSSGRPLAVPRPSSSVPLLGARDANLSIVTPTASRSRRVERQGSEKGGRGLLPSKGATFHRGMGSSVSSINTGPIPGDTEFIQISQPIRNPNASLASLSSGVRSMYSPYPMNSAVSTPLPQHSPRSNTPENGVANSAAESPRTTTPTNPGSLTSTGKAIHSPTSQQQQSPVGQQSSPSKTSESAALNHSGSGVSGDENGSRNTLTPVSDSAALRSTTPSSIKAISIPTGDNLEEDEEEELTVAQRRERTLRDQQINQITDLLGSAILSGDQK